MEIAVTSQVVVVGGGIAGCWVALKLAERGIDTVLLDYSGTQRGGVQGATARSVGAINTSPLERDDFDRFLQQLGLGQTHPDTAEFLATHLADELKALRCFATLKPIKLGLALDGVTSRQLLERIKARFSELGGRVLDGWAVHIAVENQRFQGVQFVDRHGHRKLLANALVIASGGFAGLYYDAMKLPTYGTLIGRYLEAGGLATNLEFVFKHGYGKADLGTVAPTEELSGAEVYDELGEHVEWLERELFSGGATHNHLEAFRYWRRNSARKFYIDLSYQPLFQRVTAVNAAAAHGGEGRERCVEEVVAMCRPECRAGARASIERWLEGEGTISHEQFNDLKPLLPEVAERQRFRVSQMAYFSMGGIAHDRFSTNIEGVYVSGEAMHDFGANRVGGLPWGLYLVAGRQIADELAIALRGRAKPLADFPLRGGDAPFDETLLDEIRRRLRQDEDSGDDVAGQDDNIRWFRDQRRRLRESGLPLSDGLPWLIMAEAVVQSVRCRRESRGCFYRADYPEQSEDLQTHFSCVSYDAGSDEVVAELVEREALRSLLVQGKMDCHAKVL